LVVHDRPEAGQLVEELMTVSKLLDRLKSASSKQIGARDRAAYVLLFKLLDGPKRASSLAEIVQSDLSTVSRHVAQLAREGLIEKQADADRRASLLAITDKGELLCSDLRERRNAIFTSVLSEWSDDDVRKFGQLLGRFNSELDTMYAEVVDGLSEVWRSASRERATETSE
jgi:DNA-binding MarR family transcriptional regulator